MAKTKYDMAKTKLALIQDDILAAKHALANNLSFEGLEGPQLENVLQALLAQRAVAAPWSKSGSSSTKSPHASSGSGRGSGSGNSGGDSSSGTIPTIPVNRGTTKTTPAPKKKAAAAAPGSLASKRPAPEKRRRLASSGKAAKKPKPSGSSLGQVRRSIKVGDMLSVIKHVMIDGYWEKEWVVGEVVREMNNSGMFKIKWYSNSSEVKQEPSATEQETERWMSEHKLNIEHPSFFCGHGDSPPVGPDNLRPTGAWFLHQREDRRAAGAGAPAAGSGAGVSAGGTQPAAPCTT